MYLLLGRTRGSEGIEGGALRPVGAGCIVLVGAPQGRRGGLGVVMVHIGGCSGFGSRGCWTAMSSMTMSSSQSEEDEGRALGSRLGALGPGGRTSVALHARKKVSWSLPQLAQWRGGGRLASSLTLVWSRRPWSRWGSGSRGPHQSAKVHSRDTRGVFGCSIGTYGRSGSSWYTQCIGWY